MPRGNREPKKTPPTTVRFRPKLHDWVRRMAEQHPYGQSGVINDAVAHYRRHVKNMAENLYRTIVSDHGEEP